MEIRRYAYIDALRGYAILLVIAVHSSQYFDDLPYQFLANQGARGVQLFFVASAITLCMSWNGRDDGSVSFYIRRFFRIAPMFYLALACFFWLRGFAPNTYAPYGLGIRHYLMTATFTHGFMPDTITSVVPGSWSIADEMMFYAIFPLLIAGLNRVRFGTAAVAVGVATFALASIQHKAIMAVQMVPDPTWRALLATFTDLWFVQELPCFLFGMLVFKWTAEGGTLQRRWAAALVVFSLAGMLVAAYFPQLSFLRLSLHMRYGVLFALFALGLRNWQPRLLVNPVIGWIGKVSYSGYLIHLALMTAVPIPHANYLEAFLAVTAATLFLSTITYLCVEEPGIWLGRQVIKALPRVLQQEAVATEAAAAQ
jgi:peptidoglycan/LPS O-acetylase OafA/YrhL